MLEALLHLLSIACLLFLLGFLCLLFSFVHEVVKLEFGLVGSCNLSVLGFEQVLNASSESSFDFEVWVQGGIL